MRARHYSILAAAGGLAALVAAVRLASPDTPPERTVAFRFPEGAYKAYEWSLTTTVASARGGPGPHVTSYRGRLNVRVLPGRAATTLAVQLSPLQVSVQGERSPQMEAAFSRPFTVEVDPLGRFGEARFPSDLAAADRAALDGAIRSLQIVLAADGAQRWETAEADVNGEFVATYVREQPATVQKARERYSSLRVPGAFAIRIVESSLRAELDPAGLWLASAEGSERLKIESEGQGALVEVHARFSLQPAPESLAPELALWEDRTVDAIRVTRDAPSDGTSAWSEAERERERQRLESNGVTLDGFLSALASHAPEDAAFAHEFAAFLRIYPEEALRIRQVLSDVPEKSAPLLFNVLELAGTPQAQETLAAIMEDGRQGQASRFRAVAALAGVREPTADAVDRLWRISGAQGEVDLVSSSALLALGALASRASGELGTRIAGRLVDELGATDDPRRQIAYLRALGNARAALEPEAWSRAMASDNAGVRAAAAALTSMRAGPSSTDQIVQVLEGEREATVRLSLLAALPRVPAAGPVNGALARALASEPDAQARAQIVALLAAGMKTYPANRAILQAQLQRETNRQVIIAILNSLAP